MNKLLTRFIDRLCGLDRKAGPRARRAGRGCEGQARSLIPARFGLEPRPSASYDPARGEGLMRKALRWLGWIVAGLLAIVALLFAAWVWFASWRVLGATHEASAERLPAVNAAQLAEGGRQARILGCHSCHGEGLRGRMMFDAPNVRCGSGRPTSSSWRRGPATSSSPRASARASAMTAAHSISCLRRSIRG